MTDNAEISRQLALAIGYLPEHVKLTCGKCFVFTSGLPYGVDSKFWRVFRYRDPDVIWHIAAKYKMFPFWVAGKWCCFQHEADTPELAVALAVIGRDQ